MRKPANAVIIGGFLWFRHPLLPQHDEPITWAEHEAEVARLTERFNGAIPVVVHFEFGHLYTERMFKYSQGVASFNLRGID